MQIFSSLKNYLTLLKLWCAFGHFITNCMGFIINWVQSCFDHGPHFFYPWSVYEWIITGDSDLLQVTTCHNVSD